MGECRCSKQLTVMNTKHIYSLILIFTSLSFHMNAQVDRQQQIRDSLFMDSLMNSSSTHPKEFVTATFKSTRVINLQTSEVVGKKSLDFRISHRFGDLSSGTKNTWGLDGPANLFLSLEYSYNGRLMCGLGRSILDKMSMGFLKYRLLRQASAKGMPISLTLYSSIHHTSATDPGIALGGTDRYTYPVDRLSYAHMIILARKFNRRLSFEIAPTLVHYNLVENTRDKNDIFAVGFAGRCKLTQRLVFSAEYVLRVNKYSETFSTYHNSAGIGFDIETGGHVFQIHVTNSNGVDEVQFIPYTRTSWKDLGIRVGFNISRVFTLSRGAGDSME